MPDTFTLNLFGGVTLLRNGAPVSQLTSRKALALLIYLACTRQTHSREKLADLLWDATSTTQSLSNLRTILTRLRPHIGDLITATRDTVAIDPTQPLSVDIVAWERTLAALGQPVDDVTVAHLQTTLQIYSGEFLAGFHVPDASGFTGWATVERERLHFSALRAHGTLANGYEIGGHYGAALSVVQQLLALEPLDEAAHLQAMRLLFYTGQRAAAVAHYATCCDLFAEELGAPPGAALTALHDQIQEGTLTVPGQAVSLQPPVEISPPQLPQPMTPFVGRMQELATLLAQIQQPATRLVTICGPGGVGKTRLALALGWALVGEEDGLSTHFPDGIVYVELEALPTLDQVLPALANRLGMPIERASTQASVPKAQLFAYLHGKQLLLLLDNFEHLLTESLFVAELLQQAPGVTIVVTARTRLDLHAETFFDLRGLDLANSADAQRDDLLQSDGVRLFLQSARRAWSNFPQRDDTIDDATVAAIGEICRLVGGLPLAIELAAGWVQTLTCREIADEIAQNLDLLASDLRDVPARHRSIRTIIDTAWHQLTPPEQRLLRKLSVLQGSFDRAAAQAVAGASIEVLAALARKSLLRREATHRYTLHNLIRHYAAEQLATAMVEQAETERNHSRYYANLLHDWQPALYREQLQVLPPHWREEIENLRIAYLWAVAHCALVELGQMVDGLFLLFEQASRYREGAELLREGRGAVTNCAESDRSIAARLQDKFQARQAIFLYYLGHAAEAQTLLTTAVTQARAANDTQELAFTLLHMSLVALQLGAHAMATTLAAESLALYTEQVDTVGIARAHNQLGQIALLTGNHVIAAVELEAALQLAQPAHLYRLAADCLDTLGNVYWNQGDYPAAEGYFTEALHRFQDPSVANRLGEANALHNLGFVAWSQGDYATAQRHHSAALACFRQIGNRQGEGTVLSSLGRVMERLGEYGVAAQHYTAALQLAQSSGDRQNEAITQSNLGFLTYHRGNYAQAASYFSACLETCRAIGFRRYAAVALACRSLLSHLRGDQAEAEALARQALQIGEESADPTLQAYGLTQLGHALLAQEQIAAAQAAYQHALTLRQELGDIGRAQEPIAGLAACALATGERASAQSYVDTILAHLQQDTLDRTLIPVPIYWICHQVCQATGHPQAQRLLNLAYAHLRTRAIALPDDATRHAFLHEVAVHHAVVTAATVALGR